MKKTNQMLETVLIVVLGILIVFTLGFVGSILVSSSEKEVKKQATKEEQKLEEELDAGEEEEEIPADDFQVVRGEDASALNAQKEKEDKENKDYIFYDSDSRFLTKKDLKGLTKKELSYARNEIYARHGRIYQSEELNEYFNSKDWYEPIYEADDFSDDMLNEYEKENAKFILKYEKEKGYQ